MHIGIKRGGVREVTHRFIFGNQENVGIRLRDGFKNLRIKWAPCRGGRIHIEKCATLSLFCVRDLFPKNPDRVLVIGSLVHRFAIYHRNILWPDADTHF